MTPILGRTLLTTALTALFVFGAGCVPKTAGPTQQVTTNTGTTLAGPTTTVLPTTATTPEPKSGLGSKLYVSGYRTDVFEADGEIREKTRPLGIKVIDTTSWRVEERFNLPVGLVQLSPNGSHLVAIGAGESVVWGGQRYSGSGVYVITTDGHQATHFDTGSHEWDSWIDFSADGSYAYLNRGFRVQVIDLDARQIAAETSSTRSMRTWGAAGVVSEWLGE